MKRPLVTIITACFNSETTISDTILSVLEQDYPHIEYIVKDGGSTDQTLAIIGRYGDKIKLIRCQDSGIYEAINQGIAVASGDIVGLLHSDDVFAAKDIISKIVKTFERSSCDALYGDLDYVQRNNTSRVFRSWRSGSYRHGMFVAGWMPPHPTFYVRRELFSLYGLYRPDFRISADYELMLRFVHKYRVRLSYLPEVMVKMRVGGVSNRSLTHRVLANREDMLAWKVNQLKPGLLTRFLKPLSKLRQFFNR